MIGKQRNYIATFVTLTALFTSGQCQFSGLSGMSNMFGSMNPMMSSMGSGMFGSMSPAMMSGMGGMGGMGSFSSSMMSSMMPNLIMGSAMNDPLMTLAMGTIELSGSELMVLNNLVKTIVGPEANVNPGLMVLYSSDGGLPINAAKMIPYITIMQGIAKDLKIKVPGVPGEATNEQIENYIFQRSLQWMQSRNMAGAFVENAGLFFMSNAFNNAGSGSPFESPASSTSDVNSAAATARAAASARAALANFVASQNNNSAVASKSPATPAPPTTSTKPPSLAASQSNFLASLMAASNSQSGSSPAFNLPSGMTFPGGLSMPGSTSGSSSNSGIMNPASMMAMSGMDMFGF